jgi:hypothetical protein
MPTSGGAEPTASPATARAFDLWQAGAGGGRGHQFGRCLLARRLAEADTVRQRPLVHARRLVGHPVHFPQMKETLCPVFDRALRPS